MLTIAFNLTKTNKLFPTNGKRFCFAKICNLPIEKCTDAPNKILITLIKIAVKYFSRNGLMYKRFARMYKEHVQCEKETPRAKRKLGSQLSHATINKPILCHANIQPGTPRPCQPHARATTVSCFS